MSTKIRLLTSASSLQKQLLEIEKNATRELNDLCVQIFMLATAFDANMLAWTAFAQMECWDQCKRKTPKNDCTLQQKISWLTRYVYRAFDTDSPRYNRAFKVSKSLCLYAEKGLSEKKLAKALSRRGVDHAYLKSLENKAKLRAKCRSEAQEKTSGRDPRLVSKGHKRVKNAATPETLSIEIDPQRFRRVYEMQENTSGVLTFVRGASNDGWFALTATKLKVKA
ncbi:hypothetical protein [Mesorhizobium sp. CN2-181]|uniref:hypothetical protein n=1 Tax=Mesorhizobium yinganensis TaxID=3157707 RepID=UPI0032B762D5